MTMGHASLMLYPEKRPGSSVTVQLPRAISLRAGEVTSAEHLSLEAYVEGLVERDLREREEVAQMNRVISIHVAADLPDIVPEQLIRDPDENDEEYAQRSKVLASLFGAK